MISTNSICNTKGATKNNKQCNICCHLMPNTFDLLKFMALLALFHDLNKLNL
jgi:hypothetical protein